MQVQTEKLLYSDPCPLEMCLSKEELFLHYECSERFKTFSDVHLNLLATSLAQGMSVLLEAIWKTFSLFMFI